LICTYNAHYAVGTVLFGDADDQPGQVDKGQAVSAPVRRREGFNSGDRNGLVSAVMRNVQFLNLRGGMATNLMAEC